MNTIKQIIKDINNLIFDLFVDYDTYMKWKKKVFEDNDFFIDYKNLNTLLNYLIYIKKCVKASEKARQILFNYNNFENLYEIAKPRLIKMSSIKPMTDLILLGCHCKKPFFFQEYEERDYRDYALLMYVKVISGGDFNEL